MSLPLPLPLSIPHLLPHTLPCLRSRLSLAASVIRGCRLQSTAAMSSDLFINIVAPNGVQYRQPTGLFINNEFVSSKAGGKITSIDPTYGCRSIHRHAYIQQVSLTRTLTEMIKRLPRFMLVPPRISMQRWRLRVPRCHTVRGRTCRQQSEGI